MCSPSPVSSGRAGRGSSARGGLASSGSAGLAPPERSGLGSSGGVALNFGFRKPNRVVGGAGSGCAGPGPRAEIVGPAAT
ncbi:hypothetical protein ACWD4T_02320, partial [Streptomyces umbrinus]